MYVKSVLKLSFVFMDTSPPSQFLVTLDVEGVLTPEIWIAVADHFGIDELKRTTKDEPHYQLLMEQRIRLVNEHDISLADIQSIISALSPLEGALAFLNELRSTVSRSTTQRIQTTSPRMQWASDKTETTASEDNF